MDNTVNKSVSLTLLNDIKSGLHVIKSDIFSAFWRVKQDLYGIKGNEGTKTPRPVSVDVASLGETCRGPPCDTNTAEKYTQLQKVVQERRRSLGAFAEVTTGGGTDYSNCPESEKSNRESHMNNDRIDVIVYTVQYEFTFLIKRTNMTYN